MTRRYRTHVWLLTVSLALCIASPAWAQEAKPKPPKVPKPAAEKPAEKAAEKPAGKAGPTKPPVEAIAAPEDSGVAAILAAKPATPAECVRAAKILAELNRPDLAKQFLTKALDAKLDQQQLADLGEQFGSAVFLNLADREALQPEAGQLADAVSAAVTARLEDSKRIEALIKQLQDATPEKRYEAMAGLQEARRAAIAPLLQVLADPARAGEHAGVRTTLAGMGRLSREPLMAILERADPKLIVQAILVFGEMKSPNAGIALLRPALSEKSDAEVRTTAEAALKRLTGGVSSRSEAVRLLTGAASAYFDRQQPVEGAIDGKVDLWQWDEGKRQCVARNCAADDAARAMAARWARDAFALDGDDRDVRTLYLTTMLEAAQYDNGLDRPLDEKAPAVAEAKQCGVKALDEALEHAISSGHVGAAIAAIRLLGQIGKAGELLCQGAEPSPLACALRNADRRVRMAALEAIVRLQPVQPYPGSSYVPQALAFFVATGGTRHALAAGPNLEQARQLAGLLATHTYDVDAATTGKELLRLAAASPDFELALIDVTIAQPEIEMLMQQLRHDQRTASLRVGLIARAGYFEQAERVARTDPLSKAFHRPHDEQAFRWQIEQLATLRPREFVDFETRQRQAAKALDLLAELGRTPGKLYDLRRAQDAALAALIVPKLGAKAAAVLASANSAEVQRALVDLASHFSQPLELRQAAAKAFRQNTQKHGVLLTTGEIRQQYRRYNESEKQDAPTQHVLSLILDCLEAPTAAEVRDRGSGAGK
jgi:CheY-like chemotaxis protein